MTILQKLKQINPKYYLKIQYELNGWEIPNELKDVFPLGYEAFNIDIKSYYIDESCRYLEKVLSRRDILHYLNVVVGCLNFNGDYDKMTENEFDIWFKQAELKGFQLSENQIKILTIAQDKSKKEINN